MAAIALAGPGCARDERPEPLLLEGATMGSRYRVRVDDEGAAARRRELAELAQSVLDDVDARMSTWKPDSEVSRLNRAPANVPVAVSEGTFEVLEAAVRIAGDTGGAFDVTVGPLVDAWGFGPGGEVIAVPDDAEIDRLLSLVGVEGLRLDPDARTVTKVRREIRVDLSAIAKGWAVDRLLAALAEAGVAHAMVEVGGEVSTRGPTREGGPWRIGIERPSPDGTVRLQRTIPLVNRSVASSGNYRNFYVLDGRTVAHTIDPRTGRPVQHRLRGVSVVTEHCMEADALATALMVMGPEEGLAWATERDVAALFLVQSPEREAAVDIVELSTPAFESVARAGLQ